MLPEKDFLQRSQVMKIETAIKEPEISCKVFQVRILSIKAKM